ncbi:peroxidase, partial [Trifolium medium]|nr:peroxidase [Trifolium medium]
AHTFGKARCRFITNRLYNFNNTGQPDPTLNTAYLQELQIQCPQNGSGDIRVAFDPVTPGRLDKQFYNNLQVKKGLLQSDQELFSTPGADTISLVNCFANNESFFFEHFTKSIIKMGNIGVLTGTQGEIRKQCNFVNKKSSQLDIAIELLEDDDMVSSI